MDLEKRKTAVYTVNEHGCESCQRSGYLGRAAVQEMLVIDDAVRAKIMERANATQIRQAANGLATLRYDGALKVP